MSDGSSTVFVSKTSKIVVSSFSSYADAFKDTDLANMLNIMFGQNNGIDHQNITVGGTCLGGYEYIASRGEYVKGKCTRESLLTVSADKKLTKATSTGDKIYLTENVRYFTNNGQDNPESLKDGDYVYTFRLDENFNKTNKTFTSVIERLSKIDEAQKKIENLSGDILSLQSILTDKKSRGIFGEVNLKHILSSVFGENNDKIYMKLLC